MSKTASELIEIIRKKDLLEPLFDGDLKWAEVEDEEGNPIEDTETYFKELFGEIEYKDGRCDTSEFWQVIYFKDHEVYLEIYGEYDSYGQGEHDYSGVKEVKPVTKTVIAYE
jgi:hypothetical protein